MSAPLQIDPALKQWATETQARYLDAVNQTGSAAAAARNLGVAKSSVVQAMLTLRKRAALKGWAPEHDMKRTVPDGFSVKGVSTYYDAEGKARGQWVKSRADDERRETIMRAAAEALAETLPRLAPVPVPSETDARLCNLYTITDAHIGMLAWRKEGGADWDLKEAARVLLGCFAQMITAAPPAESCVLSQLGDALHFDGMESKTPTNGHLLDADSRFEKVAAAAMRIIRHMIDLALTRHARVSVLLAAGNHDPASSVWLRVAFAAIYANDERVTVDTSPLPYYLHRHGRVMLGFHHGHLKKFDGLPMLFAAQFAEAWGQTTKRYIHMGHCHHEQVREFPGVKVVQHPTLAARDAYASYNGYLSERQATAYTYHVEHGQVGSITVTPEMVQ